jgi:peptidoglycan/xylan/chitin deacetylase (PgdA/CDA1 family)
MTEPLVLMYHAVRPLGGGGGFLEQALVVDPYRFARQLGKLARWGYRSLTLAEYADARRGAPASRTFLLTFDDAYEGLDEHVTPVLRRHNYSAVVFAPVAHLGGRNSWDARNRALSALRIMNQERLRGLANGPWEVASHGFWHVDLRRLETTARRRQLARSREALGEVVGLPPSALAYPFGYADAAVAADAAAAGFELGFLATPYPINDPLRIPRRPISNLDRGVLLDCRLSARPWAYRLEDVARIVPGTYRRVRSYRQPRPRRSRIR